MLECGGGGGLTDRTSSSRRRSNGSLRLAGAAAGLRRSWGRRLLVVVEVELLVVEKLELGLEVLEVIEVIIGLPLAAGDGPAQAGRWPERGGRQRAVHPRGDEFGKDGSPAHVVSPGSSSWTSLQCSGGTGTEEEGSLALARVNCKGKKK